MSARLVSVVVPNWNGNDVIGRGIDGLLAQDYPEYEIIVVDNGSDDGSYEMIASRYHSQLSLIRNETNVGFAEACNMGIRAAHGDYIAVLNSDTTVEPGWITEMVRGIESDESFGMAAGKTYLAGAGACLDNTGESIYMDGFGRARGRLETDRGQYDSGTRVFCPSGCAALYRKKMLEEIGMFDRSFFAYADDIDVGFRGRLLLYECAYVPTAISYHWMSSSLGMFSPLKAFLVERNRLWVAIKCFPVRFLLTVPMFTLIRYCYHFIGIMKRTGPAWQYVRNVSTLSMVLVPLKAHVSTLGHLAYLLSQRSTIRRGAKATSRDFAFWFRDYGMPAREVALNEICHIKVKQKL